MLKPVQTVYLINAGNDPTRSSFANDGAFPALSVLSLGTTLHHYLPDINVKVFDGQVTSRDQIDAAILTGRPHVVGISVLATSLQNGLHYAETAKTTGAIVILGNDQAAITGRTMMAKRAAIDYIITADIGELAFLDFVKYLRDETEIESVPKLMYRQNGEIKHNDHLPELQYQNRYNALDIIPVVDRRLLPPEVWSSYLENYLAVYGRFHDRKVNGVTTMNRARGCQRVKDPCTYCGILDLSLRFSSPEIFWQEVRAGREQVGADVFYEVFDNMVSAPRPWLERIIIAKPDDLNDVEFFIYAQALGMDVRLAGLFRRLGVKQLNMGLDSGDDTMLKRLKGPQDSVEQNMAAAELVQKAGMRIYASFVLGAPGETHESLANTIEFAKWLVDEDYVAVVEAQPLLPEFNAKAGRMLMQPEVGIEEAGRLCVKVRNEGLLKQMPEKWTDDESPNPDEIAKDWAAIFCEVDYEELDQAASVIREYARDHGYSYGKAFF